MARNLLDLPGDIVAMICASLPSAGDLDSLLQTCKVARSTGLDLRTLGELLRQAFDFDEWLDGMPAEKRKALYFRHMSVLERGLAGNRRQGPTLRQNGREVEVIRALIVGAWAGRRHTAPQHPAQHLMRFSKNLRWLRDYGNGPELFRSCRAPPTSALPTGKPELMVIQLTLSYIRIERHAGRMQAMNYEFEHTREAVYAVPFANPMFDAGSRRNRVHGRQTPAPTCLRLEPGILLHTMNLWHHHLSDAASSMGMLYWRLRPEQRMLQWTERIKAAEVSIRSHYLGFACSASEGLERIREAALPSPRQGNRRHAQGTRVHVHQHDHDVRDLSRDPSIIDMHIASYDEDDTDSVWPRWLDDAARVYHNSFSFDTNFLVQQLYLIGRGAIASIPRVSADIRHRHFTGYGREGTCNFLVTGVITPMNNQYGLPGFQRFVMAKVFLSEPDSDDTQLPYPPYMDLATALNDDTLDLLIHEGVVLPGGRTIIGRWFFYNQQTRHGQGVALLENQAAYEDHSQERAFDLAREHKGIESGPFILWAPDDSQKLIQDVGIRTHFARSNGTNNRN